VTLSQQVLVGLAAGVAVGVFFGEAVSPIQVPADGFIKLLQMTVLPYVVVSIVASLGSLDAHAARRLGLRASAVVLGLWAVALLFAMLVPLAFPAAAKATFFSTSLIERRPPFDFINLYIPSNPFHSLANGVVPAVVLFAIVLGIAMIGLERKQVLLDVLTAAGSLVSRATRMIVRLTPYGIFAITAHAAGTLKIDQLGQIQVYLVTYVAVALLLSLWVLPGLIATLTPIRHGDVLDRTRAGLVTAFIAADLFIVLPILIESCKELLASRGLADADTRDLPDVIVPASFNFPHTGKLLTLSFVFFAGWFANVTFELADYPRVALTGLLTFFGSLNAAVPFMLDAFRIPADTFQLYLATGVINSHFGALLAALHTIAVAILATAAMNGKVTFSIRRITRFAIVTLALTVMVIGGLRLVFTYVWRHDFDGARLVYGMRPVFATVPARILSAPPEVERAAAGVAYASVVRDRGVLRVCVLSNRLPYAYVDQQGALKGFDIEMSHRFAHDLDVRLEHVPVRLEQLPAVLDAGGCDLAMSGIGVTPQGATTMLYSAPYFDETLGWVVRDHLRERFASWNTIRELGGMRVGAPELPYYLQVVRERAPALALDVVAPDAPPESLTSFEAFLFPAERGSVATLLHPEFTVVVPQPDLIKVPLAYPLFRHGLAWDTFVNAWIELKRRDGTLDKLYQRWILGLDAQPAAPRWSIIRDVLHWVD
jgi:Na+/H+-dicarboxylate symporter/ABC-type amino acid transport substrate-binding protein